MLDIAKKYRHLKLSVIPCFNKIAAVGWKEFTNSPMDADTFNSLPWKESNSIAAISGVNNLACLDFDKSSLVNAKAMLDSLNLPSDYPWTVRSGSGKGFHIWFLFDRSTIPANSILSGKNVVTLYPRNENLAHHAELRLSGCYTILPPSQHTSGMTYSFFFEDPDSPPQTVSYSDILSFMSKHFTLALKPQKRTSLPKIALTKELDESLTQAASFIAGNLPKGSYSDWIRLGFALCSLGPEGLKYFRILSLENKNYSDTVANTDNKYNELLSVYNGSVSIGSFFFTARRMGWKPPFKVFWFINRGKIVFDRNAFINFLVENNFAKVKYSSHYEFIYTEDCFVKIIPPYFIKDYVSNFIRGLGSDVFDPSKKLTAARVLAALIEQESMFKQCVLEFLPTVEIKALRDTADTGWFYFRNCVLRITRVSVSRTDYAGLDGYIYSDRVINRDFDMTQSLSVFETFLMNVCAGSVERFKALKSAIGYMLHTYKNPANAKAVIFCDEAILTGAAGRSGKSLVAAAIGKIRLICDLGGRTFSFNKSFPFQQVTPATEIILFNDIDKKFPFERLFNVVTDSMVVEKKNKPEETIPFAHSPKVLMNTNYSILNNDHSSIARQFTVEFSSHYNVFRTPVDDFYHRFFDDWDADEWNAFYLFMAHCLSFYLANGLVEYTHSTLNQRKIIDGSCPEFLDFMEENLKLNEMIPKQDFLEKFRETEESFAELKMITFTKWIKQYALIKNLLYSERRPANGERKREFMLIG
ncbi:MAG: bifunctional DNA primase/polymerase [Ignavibacteriaceae bacterium]